MIGNFKYLHRSRLSPLLLFTTCLSLSSAVLAQSATDKTNFEPRFLYRHATLVDGTESGPRANMNILVQGERIVSIFADDADHAPDTASATIVDLSGQYVLPGLIDSHVHLATPPHRSQAEAVLRRDLYGGVTAVRDMADDLRSVGELARESLAGEVPAPDIYFAALMSGPAFFADERTAMTTYGATPGQVPGMQEVTAKSDLPIAVAIARGTYASGIKLYADLTADLAARITAEAHRQRIPVWAHATLYPAKPSEVVAAGVDTISHACLLVRESPTPVPRFGQPRGPANIEAFRNGDNPDLDRLLAEMARRGTILDATIWSFAAPPGTPPGPPPPGTCDDKVGGAITAQAWRAGVAISAGTDAIAPWDDPWPDLFSELVAMRAKAGLSPQAILQSATLIGARAIGREADMGSLTPGKLANMIVLSRNPLDDIENIRSITMTVKRGRLYERKDFVPLKESDLLDP